MLGKTNLLFVAGNEASELAFTPEYILTSSSGNILKIEHMNNMFFLFASDGAVLYGSDMNSLQTLKKGGKNFEAKHIIYADDVYYMADFEKITGKAVIYKSHDLISFEEVTIKTEDAASYSIQGLFLSSTGEIAALLEKITIISNTQYTKYYMFTTETLLGYVESDANFIELSDLKGLQNKEPIGISLKKDRIFATVKTNSISLYEQIMITLDGTITTITEKYNFFAADYFFIRKSGLYYSLNGVDYISIDFSKDVTDFNAIVVFEYDGNIALIYDCTENGETVSKIALATTPKELVKATTSAIPVMLDYSINDKANVYTEDYAYLGSTGGIVIKAKIDNAEVERPDVVVVKGLAAKEALKQANDYTDEKYKSITKEVQQYEETTKQYMENAFSATPEGYAELVDTVNANTVKINTVIEKADLKIKADAKGEEIHLTDSADAKVVEFALLGNAKQKTTSGSQLWPFGDLTVTNAPVNILDNASMNLHPGTYTMYVKCNVADDKTSTFSLKNKDGNSVATKVIDNNIAYNGQSITFELTNDVHSITMYVRSNVTYSNIMLNKGSTALPYEPYTGSIPSPNPDYPQEIDVAGSSGSVEVKSVGKNKLVFPYVSTTKTENGITFTDNGDGSITVNGKSTGAAVFTCIKYATLKEILTNGNKYVVSGCPKGGTTETYMFQYWSTGGNTSKDIGDGAEFVFNNSVNDANISIRIEKDVTVNNLTFYPMLSLDGGEYQPYKETTATIPTPNGLPGIPVESGGNYTDSNGQQWICDEIVKNADGSGEYIQRVGTLNLTEIKYFNTSVSTGGLCFSDIPLSIESYGKETYILCNRFSTPKGITGWNSTTPCIVSRTDNNNIRIYWQKDITTKEQANNFAANNKIVVKYILPEPIRTPLTAEEMAEIEKLSTFYPITNISNDGGCGMEVTYIADSKNYIDRMVAEQVASIIETMNNLGK